MPDLAILDVMMPDMDGYELCRKLTPATDWHIDANHYADGDELSHGKKMALEAGANDIWSKPFDMDMFRRRVYELLTISSHSNP